MAPPRRNEGKLRLEGVGRGRIIRGFRFAPPDIVPHWQTLVKKKSEENMMSAEASV